MKLISFASSGFASYEYIAFALYGYSVGADTSGPSLGGWEILLEIGGVAPNRGCEEARSPPARPATGEEVSNPPSWADVYIWGGTLEETDVSGRGPP